MLIKNKAWAIAILKFANVKLSNRELHILLEDAVIDCPYCDKKRIIDDELFWKTLMKNDDSSDFLDRNHVYSLDQLVEDYTEWYEVENACISHYERGDDRVIYLEHEED